MYIYVPVVDIYTLYICVHASLMENETMEQCVDWLESMEKTDPERYQAFLATMQSEWQAAGFESTGVSSASQGTTTTDLFHRLTDAGNGQGREEIMQGSSTVMELSTSRTRS
ncbi:hypothetical protein PsorP6_016384 [Peronosclerospora sorghi]|uniref:Uncharacterized protein n=1 Tax=Peronosclerospora sorghi TaxID=230839 RepID=A0ACC0VN59_9STRA|nr:hypothetical protein PsorP6_016384 [Peronosclerospora sorghi]